MQRYRRRLPHWDLPNVPVFLTWALHNSLPSERVFQREQLTSGAAFLAWDHLLDDARSGPRYLAEPEIAAVVAQRLLTRQTCLIHSWVIMPNHVHLLCTPYISLPELMREIKGATACLANKLLHRAGEKFWQEEYFDRLVRSIKEANRICFYIEQNPVKAGLARQPELYRWSSACTQCGAEAPRGLKPALP